MSPVQKSVDSARHTNKPAGSRGAAHAWLGFLAVLVTVTGIAGSGAAVAEEHESRRDAGANLTISSASWSRSRNRLEVSGSGTPNATVKLVNADARSQNLGSGQASRRSGAWSITVSSPRPVPCRVRATQTGGQTAERDVSNAPDNCAPKAPGGGTNVPPVANANGPYTGTTGVAISFSSSGSNATDGSISTYSWNFGDGAGSNAANPSHAYANAGNYTVTLTVTDNGGASGGDSTSASVQNVQPAPGASINSTSQDSAGKVTRWFRNSRRSRTPATACWRSTIWACTAAIWTPAWRASCRRSRCCSPR